MRYDPGLSPPPLAASGHQDLFVINAPQGQAAPLIFASPHSGRRYPQDLLDRTQLPLSSLRRLEDPFVDELFAAAPAHGASLLSAQIARAYVDLNRDPVELDPEMFTERPARAPGGLSARVKAGLGAIPRLAGERDEIYPKRLPLFEAERRLSLLHRPYHAALQALIKDVKARFGLAILIDCHSMPSASQGAGAPDFVLGDRYGAACAPGLTRQVERLLQNMGYAVARNTPFAGGYTTAAYGRPAAGVHALQIEINRGLYLQEQSLTRSSNFAKLAQDVEAMISGLACAPFSS